MPHDYYVETNGEMEGPFDLLAMMKKTRSGKVTPQTPVYVGTASAPVAAGDIPELNAFFVEFAAATATEASAEKHSETIDLAKSIKNAWKFFIDHVELSLASGMVIAASFSFNYIFSLFLPAFIVAFFGTIFTTYAYFMFLIYTLRATRMQEADATFVKGIFKKHSLPTLNAAVFAGGITLGIFAMLGGMFSSFFYLLMIVGLIGFSFYIFTPFFLLDDPSLPYKEALNRSKRWVMAGGADIIGSLSILLIINVVACSILFLPVLVTLPLTAIAFADIYESKVHL